MVLKENKMAKLRMRVQPFVVHAAVLLAIASAALADTVTYTYDALGRLTGVLNTTAGTHTAYTLDAAGNRTKTQDFIRPGQPGGLGLVSPNTTGSFNINVGGSQGDVTEYELYRATTANFSGETLTYHGGAIIFQETRGNGTYYYRVRACNGIVCSGYDSGSIVVLLPPNTPGPISITQATPGSLAVSWGSVTGSPTYELWEATNPAYTGEARIYNAGATSTSFTRGNGTWYYRVRACNASGCTGYQTQSVLVLIAPGVPGLPFLPSYDNTGSYGISWATSTGTVTAYELLETVAFGGETLVYSGTSSVSSRSGMADGVYSYRLRACNQTACSAYNATQGNGPTVYVDKIAPTPPTSVSRISPNYTIVWSGGSTDSAGSGAGSGVGSWRVYRNSTLIGTSPQPQQSFLDASPPANVTLNYVIKSVDRANNESVASPTYSMYVDTVPPTTPGNFRTTAVATGSVSLAWNASTDAFGISWYRIARSPGGANMGNGNASTTFVDSTVSSNTTYTYQIFAVDGHGVESIPASLTVTTPMGAPATPTMGNPLFTAKNTSGGWTVSWSASTGAATYVLDQNGGLSTLTTTSKIFSNQGNGQYDFKVKACSAAGLCSGFSQMKTVIVCRSGTSCN